MARPGQEEVRQMRFRNRVEAGQRLAAKLADFKGDDPVVLGLPRGGVPVVYEVAMALEAPLDVIVVRKLGVPFQPELGMGAIGEGGARVINQDVVLAASVSQAELAAVEQREQAELERRAHRFRSGRPRLDLEGRTALIVDDGIATGSTAKAACQVARQLGERGWSWRRRWHRPEPSDDSLTAPTSSSSWTPPRRSSASASSTPTSPKPVTTRWSAFSRGPLTDKRRVHLATTQHPGPTEGRSWCHATR